MTVRNEDGSNFDDTRSIKNVAGNVITLDGALSFTPGVDDIIELTEYDFQGDTIHLIYAFMTANPTFADGSEPYLML